MTLELWFKDGSNHFFECKEVLGGQFNRNRFVLSSIVGMRGGLWEAHYLVMHSPSGALIGGGGTKQKALGSARMLLNQRNDEWLADHIAAKNQEQQQIKEAREHYRKQMLQQAIENAPERPERPCAVYIIKVGDRYKIGKSVNPQQRIKGLQLPGKPETIRIYSVDRGARLELELHANYASKRGHGEWFSLTDADISDIDAFVEKWKAGVFA